MDRHVGSSHCDVVSSGIRVEKAELLKFYFDIANN